MVKSNIIAESNKVLDVIEGKIRWRAKILQVDKSVKEEQIFLKLFVKYQNERRRLQVKVWKKEKLAWCQDCGKFYPKNEIELLYTKGDELCGFRHGGKFYSYYKRIKSFCSNCAEAIMKKPRGGKRRFESFRAKKLKNNFLISVSGQWIKLNLDGVIVEIEPRNYERLYNIGKQMSIQSFPSIGLKIGEEQIV